MGANDLVPCLTYENIELIQGTADPVLILTNAVF